MPVSFQPIGGGAYVPALVAHNNIVTTPEDTPVSGNLISDDQANEGTLSVLRLNLPAAGVIAEYAPGPTPIAIPGRGTLTVLNDGSFTFTPTNNVSGTVPTVTYWVTNGSEIRLAELRITVTPVNDGPQANDGYALSFSGEAVTVNLLSFAVDPDGDVVTVDRVNGSPVSIGTPIAITNGEITYQGNGLVLVEPSIEEGGSLQFSYRVTDGTLNDSGNVTVDVGVDNLPLFSPWAPILAGDPHDQAAVDFGLTYRGRYGNTYGNGVNVSTPPYSAGQGLFSLTDREPWLYDRATTVWLLAKRTNDAAILADAMTLAETYMAGVVVNNGMGTFNIFGNTSGDPTDVKYLYSVVAWWYERERLAAGATTNQARVYRARAQAMYNQTLVSFTQTYNPNNAELWTERNAWAAIMNCLAWHWISGDQDALDEATAYVEDILDMSSQGAPLHTKDKHESDGDPTQIISPWMSGLLAEAMLQYHRTTDDARILTWLSDLGDFVVDHGLYVATGAEEPELVGLGGNRLPAYLCGLVSQYPEGEAADMRHAFDVAELLKKAAWAKDQLSLSTTTMDAAIVELEECALVDNAYWTRFTEGYPKFRVNPSRAYGWMRRCAYSNVHSVGLVPMAPINVSPPVITGSTQEGATLTVTPGTWNGSPTPVLTYQWRRGTPPTGGVNRAGETGLTTVTDEDDAENTVYVWETATNDGGVVTEASNGIAIVPVGTPEITSQPTSQQVASGATATFTVTATGTPTPSYQWQRWNGSAFVNVSQGTGGTTNSYTTETLDGADDGAQFRCQVSNVGGTVTSNTVSVSLVQAQLAAIASGNTAGANLAFALGDTGLLNWTLAGWFYWDTQVNNSQLLSVEGQASRILQIQASNSGAVPTIGDSQTGTAGGSWGANPPPPDQWVFMTFSGPTAHPGNARATWASADGSQFHIATRAIGTENSINYQTTRINGGGVGTGMTMRFQYVRGYDRTFTDQECEDERTVVDPEATGCQFFNVVEDAGGGVVSVRDATGNGRVFTLANLTLTSDGPVAGGVP